MIETKTIWIIPMEKCPKYMPLNLGGTILCEETAKVWLLSQNYFRMWNLLITQLLKQKINLQKNQQPNVLTAFRMGGRSWPYLL